MTPIHINNGPVNRRTIQRLPDWEPRLIGWLQKAAYTPFQWGEFDCALAAADALEVQTGLEFAASWRGRYTTPGGALKQLLNRGFKDVYDAMSDALESEPVSSAQLQRGDIGGVDIGEGRTLGVIWSDSIWLPEPEGLRAFPLSLVECGWRLPWAV